jgi:hypothetical protein
MTEPLAQSPLPESYLLELGRVTANFSLLDWMLRWALAELVGRNPTLGHMVCADLSLPAVLDGLTAAYPARVSDPARTQGFASLIKRAGKLSERRNQMVHSYWGVAADDSTGVRMKASYKRGRRVPLQSERLTPGDLNRFALELAALTHEVQSELFVLMGRGDA